MLRGATVAELGWGDTLHIYADGQSIAREFLGNVTFEHHNPTTGSWLTSHGHSSYRTTYREERDPRGAETPVSNPYAYAGNYVEMKFSQPLFIEGGDPFDYVSGYTKDGLPMTRGDLGRIMGKLGPAGFLSFNAKPRKTIADPDEQDSRRASTWKSFKLPPLRLPKPAPKIEGASKDQQERFDSAWYDLQSRLLYDEKCAKLFGGLGKANKALAGVTFRFVDLGIGEYPARISGSSVEINAQGGFMAKNGRLPGSTFVYGSTATMVPIYKGRTVTGKHSYQIDSDNIVLGEIDYASFVLAHELGHKRLVYGDNDDDADDYEKNYKNNRTIWDNCFK